MKLMRSLCTMAGAALLTLLAPAGVGAQNPDSAAISQLLEQVKSHVVQADDDAGTLATFTRSKTHWRTHAAQLEVIRGHVNNLIDDSNQMISMRDEGSQWQQETIDRIGLLLPEISAHMTATIHHLKENQDRTHMKPFREMVLNNEKLIHNAREIISDFVDYGEAKTKADALEKELQLPAAESTAEPAAEPTAEPATEPAAQDPGY